MTTFQMNGKTYKIVDDSPMDLRNDVCADCAFRYDSQSCADVDKFTERRCYVTTPQHHYEEVKQ